jgi:hypothetical protein
MTLGKLNLLLMKKYDVPVSNMFHFIRESVCVYIFIIIIINLYQARNYLPERLEPRPRNLSAGPCHGSGG